MIFGFALGYFLGWIFGKEDGIMQGESKAIAAWSKAFKETLNQSY